MKKTIIATVVAAVIAFIIQAASWMITPIHKNTLKFTPNQDVLLETLSANLDEDGVYSLPFPDPNNDEMTDMEFQESRAGQPWAIVSYHSSLDTAMTSQMIIGLIINLIAFFVIAMLLAKFSEQLGSFANRWLFVMSFGIVLILFGPITNMNWWEQPMHYLSGEIIDFVLTFAIGGLWLAWYIGRKSKPAEA